METLQEFIETIEEARSIRKVLEKHGEVDLENYPTKLVYKVNNRKNLFKAIADYVCYGLMPENKTLDDLWKTYYNSSKRKKWGTSAYRLTFDSKNLIKECLADIALHDADFNVYAKYETFFEEKFIVDYVDADLPNKDEADIDSVKGCHIEKITLKELLDRLTYQNVNFR